MGEVEARVGRAGARGRGAQANCLLVRRSSRRRCALARGARGAGAVRPAGRVRRSGRGGGARTRRACRRRGVPDGGSLRCFRRGSGPRGGLLRPGERAVEVAVAGGEALAGAGRAPGWTCSSRPSRAPALAAPSWRSRGWSCWPWAVPGGAAASIHGGQRGGRSLGHGAGYAARLAPPGGLPHRRPELRSGDPFAPAPARRPRPPGPLRRLCGRLGRMNAGGAIAQARVSSRTLPSVLAEQGALGHSEEQAVLDHARNQLQFARQAPRRRRPRGWCSRGCSGPRRSGRARCRRCAVPVRHEGGEAPAGVAPSRSAPPRRAA